MDAGPRRTPHSRGWLHKSQLLCDLSLAEGSVQRTPYVYVLGHTVQCLTQGDSMRGARTLWETMTLLKCAVISPCKTALLMKKQHTEHNPSTRPRNPALYPRPLPYIPHPLLTARSLIRPSTWNQSTAPRLFLEQALDRGIFRKPNAFFFSAFFSVLFLPWFSRGPHFLAGTPHLGFVVAVRGWFFKD